MRVWVIEMPQRNNTYTQQTNKTMTPINFLLNIFSLSYDVHKENKLRSSFYLLRIFATVVIFGTLTSLSLYYKTTLIHIHLNISVQLTDILQTVFDYCQYLVDLFCAYKFGRHIYYEYFKQYAEIDRIIETDSCEPIRKELMNIIIFFVSIWAVTSTLDYAAWTISYGWVTPAAFALAYLYLLLKILTNIDLTLQTMHIETRLRIIGDILQSYYNSSATLPEEINDCVKNKNWFYSSKCTGIKGAPGIKSCTNWDYKIPQLSKCYMMLMEQCNFINKMFGIRILLNSLSLLVDMVRFLNLAIRILIGSHVHAMYETGYFPFASTLFRLLTCMAILISLVTHCERAYSQSDRIISMADYLLINKKAGKEMQASIEELRQLVCARPIKFHLHSFFKLDYSLLVSIASVVVTYTIIILQSVR